MAQSTNTLHKQDPALSIDSARKLAVPSEEREISPQGMAIDLVAESEKAQRWLQNANMAIDIARSSLEEASKLALNVQKTTQDVVADAMRSGEADLTEMKTDAEEKTEQVIVVESQSEHGGFEATEVPVEAIATLYERALQVQASVEESRRALLLAKSKPLAESLKTTASLKEEVVELALNIEQNTPASAQVAPRQEPGTVVAESLLKGEVVALDEASLKKIDGLGPSSKSTEDGNGNEPSDQDDHDIAQATLTAEEILKHGDEILLADPISLDKIDGLPDRYHKGGVEEQFTAVSLS